MQFEAVYYQHKVLVYNLALHYVQNRQDAEEITQDVFLAEGVYYLWIQSGNE